jgi:predicted metal-dependent hydrolase
VTRVPSAGLRSVVVDGAPVGVRVRRSARARRVRLVVPASGPPEVVLPASARASDADRMLAEHRDWLARRLAARRAASERTPRLGLDRPGVVWMGGTAWPVTRVPHGHPRALLRNGTLVVSGAGEDAVRAVERWYRRTARDRLEGTLQTERGRLGVQPGGVTIRDQRTRWGSCSARGTLSFSWRLVVAPPEVLRYVVVHELCHLRELNHSRRFWALLDVAAPDWRRHADWLRAHGPELHAYSAAGALSAA